MAKKKTIQKGIHLRKSSKGHSVHIHSANGNKLAVLTGYNTPANAQKGISALHDALKTASFASSKPGKYAWTDHTKPAKKATPKKAKRITKPVTNPVDHKTSIR